MHFLARSSRLTGRPLSEREGILFGRRRPGAAGGWSLDTRLALAGLLAVLASFLTGTAPAAASNLLYYGGPVVHSANVILVKWGPDVRASYTDPSTGDPGFVRYLASQDGSTMDIGGVLAQYMDNTGNNSQNNFSFGGVVQINPSVAPTPPGNVLDSQLQSGLAGAIKNGTLPAPGGQGLSTIYVVLFPPGDNVCFDNNGGCAYTGGGFCAYHGSFQLGGSPTQVVYAAMVDNGPGTPNNGACGVGVASDVGNQTSVVSHEMAEAINDPLNSVSSWYDYNFNGEIADKCDGGAPATNGPWTVEMLWSNRDKGCRAGESALFHAPTASFLASSTGTAGNPLSFNAASSSDPAGNADSALNQNTGRAFTISPGIVSYRWNWGDGSPGGSGAQASHTFASAGNYQVSLTVTDRLGFTSTKTQEVSVSSATPGTPVVTTGGASNRSQTGATLNGSINPSGQTVSYQFVYGTAPGSLTSSTPVTSGLSGQSAMPVSATISGLSPSTQYYFQLVVSVGSQAYSGAVQTFTTSSSTPPPQTPVVATGPAQSVTGDGALLTGMVNPGGPASVQYAFTYGTSAGSLTHTTTQSTQAGGTTAAPVSTPVTGLAPRTTYYFRLIVSYNGQTYAGSVRSFTTTAPVPGVLTEGASSVAGHSALLNGVVNPHGTYTIYQAQYGLTAAYGHSTTFIVVGSQKTAQLEQVVLFGLTPGTTYHYRFVAQNNWGTAVGADRTFTSAQRVGTAPRFRLTAPVRMSSHQMASHPLRVHFHCSKRCLARFVMLVEHPGHTGALMLPVAVSRGQARLRRAGSGVVTLQLRARFRSDLTKSSHMRMRLMVMGYARSGNSAPSPVDQTTITLF